MKLLLWILSSYFALCTTALEESPEGLYSDMWRDEKTGDLSGVEAFIVYGGGGYHAFIQCAAGEVPTPLLLPVFISAEN